MLKDSLQSEHNTLIDMQASMSKLKGLFASSMKLIACVQTNALDQVSIGPHKLHADDEY
jgi:hypothetical protein